MKNFNYEYFLMGGLLLTWFVLLCYFTYGMAERQFKSRGRKASPDGFYFITVIFSTGNSSHSILILKKGSNFYLFDSNGKEFANLGSCSDYYRLNIFYDGKNVTLQSSISPDQSWNRSANCSMWGIVIPILYGGKFENDTFKPYTHNQINKFYKFMEQGYGSQNQGSCWIESMKKKFIDKSNRKYTTKSDTIRFIREMRMEIDMVINCKKKFSFCN